MSANRRNFLKFAGLSLAGMAVGTGCATSQAKPEGHGDDQGNSDKSGPRWAMLVDLTTPCPEGCQACRTACHLVHNVPDWDEPRHEVKWIWNEHYQNVFTDDVRDMPATKKTLEMPVPVTCNHCANPPCVRVCPTQSTYISNGGLVAMDMHRCIGCRYCMAACPFGARSFNWKDPRLALEEKGRKLDPSFPTRRTGVVEKCNFCAERIVANPNAKPTCVEACEKVCSAKGRPPVLAFGDINKADSPLIAKMRQHAVHMKRRRPDLGTKPHVFYLV